MTAARATDPRQRRTRNTPAHVLQSQLDRLDADRATALLEDADVLARFEADLRAAGSRDELAAIADAFIAGAYRASTPR